MRECLSYQPSPDSWLSPEWEVLPWPLSPLWTALPAAAPAEGTSCLWPFWRRDVWWALGLLGAWLGPSASTPWSSFGLSFHSPYIGPVEGGVKDNHFSFMLLAKLIIITETNIKGVHHSCIHRHKVLTTNYWIPNQWRLLIRDLGSMIARQSLDSKMPEC